MALSLQAYSFSSSIPIIFLDGLSPFSGQAEELSYLALGFRSRLLFFCKVPQQFEKMNKACPQGARKRILARILANPGFPADLVTFTEEILNGKYFFVQCIILIYLSFSVKQVVIVRYFRNSDNSRMNQNWILKSSFSESPRPVLSSYIWFLYGHFSEPTTNFYFPHTMLDSSPKNICQFFLQCYTVGKPHNYTNFGMENSNLLFAFQYCFSFKVCDNQSQPKMVSTRRQTVDFRVSVKVFLFVEFLIFWASKLRVDESYISTSKSSSQPFQFFSQMGHLKLQMVVILIHGLIFTTLNF